MVATLFHSCSTSPYLTLHYSTMALHHCMHLTVHYSIMTLLDFTLLYHGSTSLYFTLQCNGCTSLYWTPNYCSPSLYSTLHYSCTIVLPHSTWLYHCSTFYWLYITLPWIYFILFNSILLHYCSTLLSSSMDLLHGTWL